MREREEKKKKKAFKKAPGLPSPEFYCPPGAVSFTCTTKGNGNKSNGVVIKTINTRFTDQEHTISRFHLEMERILFRTHQACTARFMYTQHFAPLGC
jgi:hypothetical protein